MKRTRVENEDSSSLIARQFAEGLIELVGDGLVAFLLVNDIVCKIQPDNVIAC